MKHLLLLILLLAAPLRAQMVLNNGSLSSYTFVNQSATNSLTNGLIAYWSMDATNNLADSWSTNTLINSNMINVAGLITNAVTNAVTVNRGLYRESSFFSTQTKNTNFSISMFVNSKLSVNNAIIGIYRTLTEKSWLLAEDTTLRFYYTSNGTATLNASIGSALANLGWTHVTLIYYKPALLYYSNAVFISSNVIPALHTNSAEFCIGSFNISTTPQYSIVGAIDDTGIWSRSLTPDEITRIYNNKNSGRGFPW